MQFSEITGATLRIGYGTGAFDVTVTNTTDKWIDGLLQPSGDTVVMVISQLAEGTDLESYGRSGVFANAVPWIAPGLAVFMIASAGNSHFWIHSLEKVG